MATVKHQGWDYAALEMKTRDSAGRKWSQVHNQFFKLTGFLTLGKIYPGNRYPGWVSGNTFPTEKGTCPQR
jgi:hypothetical protein